MTVMAKTARETSRQQVLAARRTAVQPRAALPRWRRCWGARACMEAAPLCQWTRAVTSGGCCLSSWRPGGHVAWGPCHSATDPIGKACCSAQAALQRRHTRCCPVQSGPVPSRAQPLLPSPSLPYAAALCTTRRCCPTGGCTHTTGCCWRGAWAAPWGRCTWPGCQRASGEGSWAADDVQGTRLQQLEQRRAHSCQRLHAGSMAQGLPVRPAAMSNHSPCGCFRPCRLPDLPGMRPSRDVQFASSLTLQGDELLIGYGAGDCHAGG